MNTITIKLEATELIAAINNLAQKLGAESTNVMCKNEQVIVEGAFVQSKEQETAEVPTAAEDIAFDITDVRKAISEYGRNHGIDQAKAILQSFGVDRVSDLPADQFKSVIDMIADKCVEV